MGESAEILIVDYDRSTPRAFNGMLAPGYHVRTACSNAEAMAMAPSSDLIVMIASERKRECVKLMEALRNKSDVLVNFIVVLGGSDDQAFMDRIDGLTFQSLRKGHFSPKELAKAIHNAVEMKGLKVREKRFVEDLDRIEDELKRVEHRLYTISSIKSLAAREGPFLN